MKTMSVFKSLTIAVLFVLCQTLFAAPTERDEISQTLDRLHNAAAAADGGTYFSLFSEDGVFFGTDIKERWNINQFKEYALPIFKTGKGWTYKPEHRNIFVSRDKQTAWFDEILDSATYGQCRGTGVLVHEMGMWRIAQYHLTIPIPNEIAKDVVAMIRKLQK
jgi:hypothetical protein